MSSPSVTPASASRPGSAQPVVPRRRGRRHASPGPGAPAERRQVRRAVAPHHVGPVVRRRSPTARRPGAATASTTSRIDASMPSARSDVTPLSAMPHGTMWPNIAMSGSTLSAKPCIDRPRESLTPTAQILRGASELGADPHAGEARQPADVGQPEVAEHVDDELLDRADVGHGVGDPAAALPGHGEDRVADQLARARGR